MLAHERNKIPQKMIDTEDLENLLLYHLENAEMSRLAEIAQYIFGVPVTFKEDGGPGGVISDIVVHWDQKI